MAVLQRPWPIVWHMAITLTYKVEATGSRWAGEIMVLVLVEVLWGIVVVYCLPYSTAGLSVSYFLLFVFFTGEVNSQIFYVLRF